MVDPFDEALLPRAQLETYAVPEVPAGFTDRVMTQLHATSPSISHRPSPAPWIVAAVAGACAIAAMTTLFVRWRAEPAPAAPAPAAPTVVGAPAPEPVEVAAPAPIVAPPAPATGDLVIVTTPRDAIVRIDGQDVTNAEGGSPHVRTNLVVGRHTVEVAREGFVPWRTTLDVPPRALELAVELAAEVPPTPAVEPRPRSKRPAAPGRSGSPDLKDPFGEPRDDEPSGGESQDLADPFHR